MATATQNPKAQQQTPPAGNQMARRKPMVLARDEEISELETAISRCGETFALSSGTLARSFAMARGLRQLNELITEPMLDEIMELMDSPLGFQTDRDPMNFDKNGKPLVPYGRDVVKRCVIEAAIRGARWVGNEFNIIAKRPYLAKGFFQRRVSEIEGLTDLKTDFGVPTMANGGALVPAIATWKLDGNPMRLERIVKKTPDGDAFDGRIPIRVNAQMGADAILGKAERKLLAAVYKLLTGSKLGDEETDEPGVIEAEGTVISENPAAEKAEAEAAQAAHEGPQDPAPEEPSTQVDDEAAADGDTGDGDEGAGREPGDEPDEAPDAAATSVDEGPQNSDLYLSLAARLNHVDLTAEENTRIKQEAIDAYGRGDLSNEEGSRLQELIARNAKRFKPAK